VSSTAAPTLSDALRRTLERLGLRTVLDVGANEGQFAGDLRAHAGFTGRIHSYEPGPVALGRLRTAAADDPAWTVHGHGLGSRDAELVLTEYDSSPLSSLHAISPYAERTWNFTTGRPVRVPIRRLDAVVPTPDDVLLKLDTQGHDLEVLDGAHGCLRQVRALLIELSVHALYAGTPPFSAQLARLEQLGFEPIGFWPVNTETAGGVSTNDLRVVEFDGLFLNAR
jgi:FkbM family methyltransferase